MDLSNNMLYEEVLASYTEMKNLILSNLFWNKLYGTIPEFVG